MSKETIRINGILKHSSVNGPGVRLVVFFQGCPHHCPECQNPETWDLNGGEERNLKELTEEILKVKYLDGITLSGGDPLMQPEAAEYIIKAAKEAGLDVWVYTGWTWEQLLDGGAAGAKRLEAIKDADVLVDGRFVKELLSEDVIFRGSSNQRLVDIKMSIKEGKMVLYEY